MLKIVVVDVVIVNYTLGFVHWILKWKIVEKFWLTSLSFNANSSDIVLVLTVLFKLFTVLEFSYLHRMVVPLSCGGVDAPSLCCLFGVERLLEQLLLLILLLLDFVSSSTPLCSIISLTSLIFLSIFSSSKSWQFVILLLLLLLLFSNLLLLWVVVVLLVVVLVLLSLLSDNNDSGVVEGDGGDVPFCVIVELMVVEQFVVFVSVFDVVVDVNCSFNVFTSFSANVALCVWNVIN